MTETVIVTGAGGGLGGAVVRRFSDSGWRVVAVDRGRHTAGGSGGSDRAGGSGEAGVVRVSADLFDEEAVASVVEVAGQRPEAPLRAVINLVGGYADGGRVHETPVERFEAQLRLNLRPTYLVTAAALPRLIAAGGGSVVCVGSRIALRPFPGAAGSITAKAALLALVSTLAVEYRDDRVRVNAVLPSVIDTPANRAAQPDADYGRWVTPQQLADVIAYLCSDAAAATSGAHIPVYGRA